MDINRLTELMAEGIKKSIPYVLGEYGNEESIKDMKSNAK